jgi:actin-related protein
MIELWRYIFTEIYRESCTTIIGEHVTQAIVMIESNPLPIRAHREKMLQVMFDTFNVPAVYIVPQSICTLLAQVCREFHLTEC